MPVTPPLIPGRSCPAEYRYGTRALAVPATLYADSLWIAGGLYGNIHALGRLEEMYAAERGESMLIVNGDFHWFDIDDGPFAEIERGVTRHAATRKRCTGRGSASCTLKPSRSITMRGLGARCFSPNGPRAAMRTLPTGAA